MFAYFVFNSLQVITSPDLKKKDKKDSCPTGTHFLFYPSINACSSISLLTRLSSTVFCSFLLVIHLWQPTPPSHTWSLSICCLRSQTRHRLTHFTWLCLFAQCTLTHSSLFPNTTLPSFCCIAPTVFCLLHRRWYQVFLVQTRVHDFLNFLSMPNANSPCFNWYHSIAKWRIGYFKCLCCPCVNQHPSYLADFLSQT